MDAIQTQAPPLQDIIHLVFMFHETNAYALRGSSELTATLREQENTLYECHNVMRSTVENYAAQYDREAVLSYFRNDPTYAELEKAFARAPAEKFNIIRRLTPFWSSSRIEGKHVRTIPVSAYHRAIHELNALPPDHRHN